MFFKGREAKTRLKLGRRQNAIKCVRGCSFEGPGDPPRRKSMLASTREPRFLDATFSSKVPPGGAPGTHFGRFWASPGFSQELPRSFKIEFFGPWGHRGGPKGGGETPSDKEHQNSCNNCGYVPFQRTVFVRFVAAFFVPCLAPKFQKRSVLNILGGPLKYCLHAQCQAIASESSRLLWIVGSVTLRAFRYLLIQVFRKALACPDAGGLV